MTPLTWTDIVQRCSRTESVNEQMIPVTICSLGYIKVAGTIVPTRMHDPGFYVRSPSGTPWWASWQLRSDDDLRRFKNMVDQGFVFEREGGT